MGTVHTTPADSDTRTTKVRDSMMLPSMRVTVGLLEWSSYEVIMVQSIVDLGFKYAAVFFVIDWCSIICSGRISEVCNGKSSN